jgi:glutamine synthetase
MRPSMGTAEPARPTDAAGVVRWLGDAGVTVVALPFVDPAAIVRVKTIPLSRFARVADEGVGLSILFNVAMSDDRFALTEGLIDGPSGDLRLRPDPSATVPLVALPGWAWAPVDQYTQGGEPFAACPRAFARNTAARYEHQGLRVEAAFEIEFSVGARTDGDGFQPAHTGPGYSDIALVANHAFALDLVTTIEAQGLGLQQFHPEYADGQFELSIAPRDPVGAADAAMVVKQTVRAVAGRHGWITSFAPRVEADTGNGFHLHLSLWDGERNLLSGGEGAAGMDATGEAFVAGILRALPALVAITAPTCASYLRLQPHHWAGAMRCWGVENREAALRFIAAAGGEAAAAGAANLEVKPVDGTTNPYMSMGGMLAAGLDGIEQGLRLPPPTEEDPTMLADDVAKARGVEQLPASLSEAVEQLAGSALLRDAMGEFLFRTFLATRRGESERSADLDEQELIRRTRWRY